MKSTPSGPSQLAPSIRTLPRTARWAGLAGLLAALAMSAWAEAPLVISPTSTNVAAGGSVTFSASGGAGGYSFSLSANSSGASIDASSGAYTAGSRAGGTDVVTVTDATGGTRTAQVRIKPAALNSPDLGGHRVE